MQTHLNSAFYNAQWMLCENPLMMKYWKEVKKDNTDVHRHIMNTWTSSCCWSNRSMHLRNLRRCFAGLSSSSSLKTGRKSPHLDISGTGCEKQGIEEKSRGANLWAKRAANAFDILIWWSCHWIHPSWSLQGWDLHKQQCLNIPQP